MTTGCTCPDGRELLCTSPVCARRPATSDDADTAALIAKATRTFDTGQRTTGVGTISWEGPGKPTQYTSYGGERIIALVNPDGPELASALARQQNEIAAFTPAALQAALEADDKWISYSVAERVIERMRGSATPPEPDLIAFPIKTLAEVFADVARGGVK